MRNEYETDLDWPGQRQRKQAVGFFELVGNTDCRMRWTK